MRAKRKKKLKLSLFSHEKNISSTFLVTILPFLFLLLDMLERFGKILKSIFLEEVAMKEVKLFFKIRMNFLIVIVGNTFFFR